MYYRIERMEPTTGAVAWTLPIVNDNVVKRIDIKIDATPTTVEEITITKISAGGDDYNTKIGSVDANKTSFSFVDIGGLDGATALLVEYANTDGNSVAIEAIVDRVDE